MKSIKYSVLSFVCLLAVSGQAWSYGYYNWYDGYSVSVSSGGGSSWSYAPTSSGWGWWGPVSATTYARADGNSNYSSQTTWWNATAQSSASDAFGDRAYAYAKAQTGNWWPGGYTYTYTATQGSNSYAYAQASNHSRWWYSFYVPWAYWNSWKASYGSYIPMYLSYYYWGWFDGTASVGANIQQSQGGGALSSVLNGSYTDNGNGTYTANGSFSGLTAPLYDGAIDDPNDPYNPSSTHAGWQVNGGNGGGQTPHDTPFSWGATEQDAGNGYVNLTVVGDIYENIPEPASLALLGLAGLMAVRRRKLPA